VPALIDQVIAKGMAKDPHHRYATTIELAHAAHDAITTPIPRPAQNLYPPPAFVANPAPPTPATEPAAQQQPAYLNLAPTQQRPPGWPPVPQPRPADHPPAQIGTPPPPRGRRKPLAIAAGAVIVVAVAVTVRYLLAERNSQPSTISQPSTTSRPSTTVTPVAEAALAGLLLSPDQINTAMGATGLTVSSTTSARGYDDSAIMPDKACLPMSSPVQSTVLAGSGWSALRGQALQQPPGDTWTLAVKQDVVLFSSAHDADAFFTASAQSWPACANRQYTSAIAAGKPPVVWTVGPVSNTNGTLSATETSGGGDSSWTWSWSSCQRALTVANNVAIDVIACSKNRSDSQSDAAVKIARQIAAKVAT
jgi:serine/threonine kinase PknH